MHTLVHTYVPIYFEEACPARCCHRSLRYHCSSLVNQISWMHQMFQQLTAAFVSGMAYRGDVEFIIGMVR